MDAITGQPLRVGDVPSALLGQLTRPLLWSSVTSAMWTAAGEASASAPVRIVTVGKGARGLGMTIRKDMARLQHGVLADGRKGNEAGVEVVELDVS